MTTSRMRAKVIAKNIIRFIGKLEVRNQSSRMIARRRLLSNKVLMLKVGNSD